MSDRKSIFAGGTFTRPATSPNQSPLFGNAINPASAQNQSPLFGSAINPASAPNQSPLFGSAINPALASNQSLFGPPINSSSAPPIQSLFGPPISPFSASSTSTSSIFGNTISSATAPSTQSIFRLPAITPATDQKLSSTEFVRLLQGPIVTLLIGPESVKYTLPKALAEYYSPVLERAFNGSFKEAEEQMIRLVEENTPDIEMVIQWMYSHGKMVELDKDADSKPELSISRWIGFAQIGDRIDLRGCDSFAAAKIKNIIKSNHGIVNRAPRVGFEATDLPFSGKHIRAALDLPFKHPIRSLLTDAVAPSYLWDLRLRSAARAGGARKEVYGFQKEIDELEAFRSDLFLAIADINLRATIKSTQGQPAKRVAVCPFTQIEFNL